FVSDNGGGLEVQYGHCFVHLPALLSQYLLRILLEQFPVDAKEHADGRIMIAPKLIGDRFDLLLNGLRRDAMFLVVRQLLLAAAVGLVDSVLKRRRNLVSIEDYPAVYVSSRPADGLDKGGL